MSNNQLFGDFTLVTQPEFRDPGNDELLKDDFPRTTYVVGTRIFGLNSNQGAKNTVKELKGAVRALVLPEYGDKAVQTLNALTQWLPATLLEAHQDIGLEQGINVTENLPQAPGAPKKERKPTVITPKANNAKTDIIGTAAHEFFLWNDEKVLARKAGTSAFDGETGKLTATAKVIKSRNYASIAMLIVFLLAVFGLGSLGIYKGAPQLADQFRRMISVFRA